ncbi:hypothetical protein QFC22_004660 [Naganishia vaughanmartiniae]|uniref:Uncharacterized protein n=1 Tax=Naganishia vaughanmartiniae TaxID=1424756 RepID=A0ACC2X2M4_9TREE|nr:hypothetical protein QFC22_004660 [Naganishia vaughanmartiniae]
MCEYTEVRTSPAGDVLFASTRGLEPSEKGYVIAIPLDPATSLYSGESNIHAASGSEEYLPVHRWQTPTSGGWANAIAVCPEVGAKGEVWMTLTDSEEGWVWMLRWTLAEGFEVVGSVNLNDSGEGDVRKAKKAEGKDIIGASVTVWYD